MSRYDYGEAREKPTVDDVSGRLLNLQSAVETRQDADCSQVSVGIAAVR